METDKKISSLEALRISLDTRREIEGRLPDSAKNQETARNVVREELGNYIEQPMRQSYDDDTRDLLIVNGREDSAFALLNTLTLLRVQKSQRRLLLIAIAILLYIAFRVTP